METPTYCDNVCCKHEEAGECTYAEPVFHSPHILAAKLGNNLLVCKTYEPIVVEAEDE